MSDITMRLTLNEDVSTKMKKIVSEAKNVSRTMKTIGEEVDDAFDSSMAYDFSNSVGKAVDDVESDFSQLGKVIDNSFKGIGDVINEQTGILAKSVDDATGKLHKALTDMDKSNGLAGIGSDADTASRSLSGLNSNADTLGSTLKRLFTIAAGAVALDRLKDFGLSTLEESAAATARESQFSQVFAGAEDSASAGLSVIAADTDILENRMKESYTSIAAFAKTTGMEVDDAVELSNRAMAAVADSAAFYDRSMEETTEALQSYLKGNYENDAFLGLASTEYTRNAEALELYGKEFQELTEEQKQWTLLSMVEEANELSGALGQAAREADTWTNQTGNLAQAWEDTKASLGDEIIDQSIGTVKTLTDNMDEIEEPLSRIFGVAGDIMEDVVPMIPSGLGVIASGVETIGSALGKVYNVVSDNPEAVKSVLTGIASGMVALKAANSATKIGSILSGTSGLTGALSSLSTTLFGSPWAAGAAAVAGAVGGIAMAIDQYNDLQVSKSLDDHFGSIEFNAAQVEDAASHILNADYLVNVNAALGEFENADSLREEAEAALRSNDPLEWKSSVGILLTPEEQTDYISNIENYVDSSIDELESRTYSAHLSVETFLQTAEGNSLGQQISQWAAQDQLEINNLSAQLTTLVENALTDGMIDVNEQAAIDILQSKINSILSGWKSSEAEAELDLIEQQYGRLSGKDLTDETFAEMVEALGEQRETAAEALDANSTEFYELINGLADSGRLTESENELFHTQWSEAERNQRATDLINSMDFETNTLSDTYGALLSGNYEGMEQATQSYLSNINSMLASEDYGSLSDSLMSANTNAMVGTNFLSSADQQALAGLYDLMEPDVDAMSSLIDEYTEMGQAIPQQLMDSYNEAMQIGAASGDADAAWQVFANEMVADPANKELLNAINEGTVAVPEELHTALERALAETTDDPLQLNDMTAEIEDIQFDQSKVDELLSNAAELAGLDATGTTTINGGELAVEYEVTAGQTLSEIATNAGIALDELLAANPEITNPNELTVGQVINIPADAVTVDASGVGEAVEEQAQSQIGNTETEGKANVKITESETNSSEAYSAAQEELDNTFSDSMETEGYAGIEIQKQSDNINEVYSQTSTELRNAFNTIIPVTARASITVDYSIANPTKTITFSGDATGTGTVYAHAAGGIFEEPHYGLVAEAGPEAIIPLDGSDNAFSLWQEAGERLGAFDDAAGELQGPAFAPPEEGSMRTEYVRNDSRNINISINGNGVISAGAGMSREAVANYIMENIRDIILDIAADEDLGEGDGSYDW